MKTTQNQYKTCSQDSANYSDGYRLFLERTNFRHRIEEQVRQYIQSHPKNFNIRKLRILDIGCGNGQMTKQYANAVKEIYPSVELSLTLIEPAQEALKEAVSVLKDYKIESSYSTPIEKFLENSAAEFDWIIASYIFYHVDTQVIPKLLKMLSQTGLLMIAMGAPDHPLKKDEPLKSLAKHGDSSSIHSALTKLEEQGLAAFHVNSVITDLNLKGFWEENGVLTHDGVLYFSFTYNCDIEHISEEMRSALTALLLKIEEQRNFIVHPKHHLFWVNNRK
ncbi:MAG: class I SAM-dependent methyltransferase [Bacteriovoracia bacterium]